MGSIRLFALGFFQSNDPIDLDPADLDPELPIHLTGHPSKEHRVGPMEGRKEPFRIEYPLQGILRSTLNEVSGVTPKADSQGPVKCPVKERESGISTRATHEALAGTPARPLAFWRQDDTKPAWTDR
jgi:hypothetical protein